ncbi:MAG: helix-turn-helix transcriptional regulator [Bacillota bacterium]|nr:helix-turn-helix transcriptional regulator [Bacillota bacterium]
MSKLRRLRLDAGMKQAELAERVGVSQATISSWENDQYPIGSDFLPALCELFNVTADELLGIKEPREFHAHRREGVTDVAQEDIDLVKRLQVIVEMHREGSLTDTEFAAAKRRVLGLD